MCYSLSNSVSTAADELPFDVEFLIKHYFSHSSQRIEKFEELYKTMNEGTIPLRSVALSTTRWLAFSNAVTVILKQFEELREFFGTAATTTDWKSSDVRRLADLYRRGDVLLYLQLVDNVLKDVTTLNVSFQKSNGNIISLHEDLRTSMLSLFRRIFKPAFLKPVADSNPSIIALHQADLDAVRKAPDKSNNFISNSLLSLDAVDYGLKFSEYAEKFSINKTITPPDLEIVKQRSREYILRLVKELVKRLPHNLGVIEKINYFSPTVCLTQASPVSVKDLPWELADGTIDRDEVESQWRKLRTLRLTNISAKFDETVSPEEF